MKDINIWVVFYILFAHWVADFILQTHWQATNKSKNNRALFNHVGIYSAVMSIFIVLFFGINYKTLLFFLTTFVFHFTTDYFTSRLNTYLWNKKDVHNFFVSVGADQFLHAFQLIFTVWYLYY